MDIKRGVVISVTRPTAFAVERSIAQCQGLFDRTASVTRFTAWIRPVDETDLLAMLTRNPLQLLHGHA